MKIKNDSSDVVGSLDTIITLTPVSWVLGCGFGAFDLVMSGSYLAAVGEFLTALIFTGILLYIGTALTGTKLVFDKASSSPAKNSGRIKVLLIELVILFMATGYIYTK